MTTSPPIMMSRATISSTQRVGTAPGACLPGSAIALLRDETGFLHKSSMLGISVLHPIGVLLARHERVVERGFLGEFLPVGKLAHFLEDIDVVVDLLLRHARRHEEAAQHQVFNVEALRLARRDVLPRL